MLWFGNRDDLAWGLLLKHASVKTHVCILSRKIKGECL